MYFCHLCLAFASSAMLFRRTRRMVLVLLVVLQGGLLDGQLAVPPLVARVFQFIGGRIAGRLGQKTKGIVATYLDATDFRLQRVEEMAPRKGIRRHTKKLLNCVLYGNWWNQLLARRVPLKNVVLPFDDTFQVAEAINGTQFEKFMCEVLKALAPPQFMLSQVLANQLLPCLQSCKPTQVKLAWPWYYEGNFLQTSRSFSACRMHLMRPMLHVPFLAGFKNRGFAFK